MSNETPNKVVRPIGITILNLLCITLFSFFLYSFVSFAISQYNVAVQRGTAGPFMAIIVCGVLLLVFFAYGMPYILWRLYPTLRFYDDGFTVGKGEKILYENLDYFFDMIPLKVNKFAAIWYKNGNKDWERIVAKGYPQWSFKTFQEDFVQATYPKAMEQLEAGETLEFGFKDPKKSINAFSKKKFSEKMRQFSMTIKLTKDSITFDDETYDFAEYKVRYELGSISVADKEGNVILVLPNKALVHRVNLLVALIDTLGEKA